MIWRVQVNVTPIRHGWVRLHVEVYDTEVLSGPVLSESNVEQDQFEPLWDQLWARIGREIGAYVKGHREEKPFDVRRMYDEH